MSRPPPPASLTRLNSELLPGVGAGFSPPSTHLQALHSMESDFQSFWNLTRTSVFLRGILPGLLVCALQVRGAGGPRVCPGMYSAWLPSAAVLQPR